MACTLGGVTLLAYVYNLNHIKSKTVGDGQHGTARWATKPEIRKTYAHVPYTPSKCHEKAPKVKKRKSFCRIKAQYCGCVYSPYLAVRQREGVTPIFFLNTLEK